MSNAQDAYGNGGSGGPQSSTYRQWACGSGRRGYGRWSAFDLVALVLGLVVFWPIGLAIFGYKMWQQKRGGPDLQTLASGAWSRARDAFQGSGGPARGWTPSASSWTPGSGNSAFDAWKAAELARLEEERRKLDNAHREFADFMDNVRKAKDREEFDRFMNERRNRQA